MLGDSSLRVISPRSAPRSVSKNLLILTYLATDIPSSQRLCVHLCVVRSGVAASSALEHRTRMLGVESCNRFNNHHLLFRPDLREYRESQHLQAGSFGKRHISASIAVL